MGAATQRVAPIWTRLPIEDLDLSERPPQPACKRAQVNTVGELVQKTEDDLLAITNFGQKSLDEVLLKLDERGLALRPSRVKPDPMSTLPGPAQEGRRCFGGDAEHQKAMVGNLVAMR